MPATTRPFGPACSASRRARYPRFSCSGGPKERTAVWLNKVTLAKNKRDKVVSKKCVTTGKRACKLTQAWAQAVKTARKLNKVAPSVKKTSSPKLLRAG